MFLDSIIADCLMSLGKGGLTWQNAFPLVILQNYFTYNSHYVSKCDISTILTDMGT